MSGNDASDEEWTPFHSLEPPPEDQLREILGEILEVPSSDFELVLVKSSQNFSYRIQVGGGKDSHNDGQVVFARVGPDQHQKLDHVKAEMFFLRTMSEKGVDSVCSPVHDNPVSFMSRNTTPNDSNSSTCSSSDATENGGTLFHVVVFRAARGDPALGKDGFGPVCAPDLVAAEGRWLAKLHLASSSLSDSEVELCSSRWRWDQVHNSILARGVDILAGDAYANALLEYSETFDYVSQLPTSSDVYGLIHGDLNVSNFFVERTVTAAGDEGDNNDEVKEEQQTNGGTTPSTRIDVFDWDQMQFGWFAYDVAIVLFSAQNIGVLFDVPELQGDNLEAYNKCFLEAYEEVRPLSNLEKEWLPRFITLREQFYLLYAVKTLRDVEKDASKMTLPAGVLPMFEKIVAVYKQNQDPTNNA